MTDKPTPITEDARVVKLQARPDAPLSFMQSRFDARRDTRLLVQRNVNKHVHVTIGSTGCEVTMILHPHFAARLAKGLTDVLSGEEMAFD